MALTKAQQIFADEYLKDLNGTRAYKVAYPRVKKDTVAATNAGRLLRNAEVASYVNNQLEVMHNERTADAQEILEYLTSVMRGKQKEQTLASIGDLGQEIIDIDVGARDRLKAAELLGKRHSLFSDKVNLNVESVTFVDDVPEDDDDG